MKTKLYILILLFHGLELKAQVPYVDTASCVYSSGFLHPYIDSIFHVCDTSASNFKIHIEPTLDNIWNKTKTLKFGSADIRDTSCTMFTDSNFSYPINNMSAFYFHLPQVSWMTSSFFSYYIKFWHRYETDTLVDGCWLEFSTDSGLNWYPIDSFQTYSLSNVYRYCNLYGHDGFLGGSFDTLLNGRKAWSGSSNGWQYTAMHLNFMLPIKKERNNPINAIRFVFGSDGINGGKAGWIIYDFSVGYASFVGATEDINQANPLTFYPNPSSSGIFRTKLENIHAEGIIQVYTIQGQKIVESDIHSEIDLNNFTNGVYFYIAVVDGQLSRGLLHKQ